MRRSKWCNLLGLVVFAIVSQLSQSQIVRNACGENVIFVNGKYHRICALGYIDDYGSCVAYVMPQCPIDYVLVNGLCYQKNQRPHSSCSIGSSCQALPCTNYPTYVPQEPESKPKPKPEPQPEPGLTPEPFSKETAIPAHPPAGLNLLSRCPAGSTFANGKCRKVLCPEGELYEGRCLQPTCPEGTVWRGHMCQEPAYITTILEIDNVFINEVRHTPGKVTPINVNNVEYHTQTPEMYSTATSAPPAQRPTQKAKYTTTSRPTMTPAPAALLSTPNPTEAGEADGCCWIVTPRICKQYGRKWVCFNRRYRRCDPKVCTNPLIYLKAPQIRYDPPVMVMPPNPPLAACIEPGCDRANVVDCSGCPHNRRETCSPYCYRYMCPNNACSFMDLQQYCTQNPGEPGCTASHGCMWDWCAEKCN